MRISKKLKISNLFSAFIITRLREEKQIGLEQIANVLQINPEIIERIEKAKDGLTIEQLHKIERNFGRSISSLFREELEKSRLREEYADLIELLKEGERVRETHVP